MDPGARSEGWRGGLTRFLVLYAALYGAYGLLSPILARLPGGAGPEPGQIGALLAAAGALRLGSAPGRGLRRSAPGRPAPSLRRASRWPVSRSGAPARRGFWQLLGRLLLYAAGTAAPPPLADALALAAARGGAVFQYGWGPGRRLGRLHRRHRRRRLADRRVRPAAALVASGLLFIAASGAAWPCRSGAVRRRPAAARRKLRRVAAAGALSSHPRRGASLVIGAHALHDAFAMILWRDAGIGAGPPDCCGRDRWPPRCWSFCWPVPRSWRGSACPPGSRSRPAPAPCAGRCSPPPPAIPLLAAAEALHGLSFRPPAPRLSRPDRGDRAPRSSGPPPWRSTAPWRSACPACSPPWPPVRSTARSALRPSGRWRRSASPPCPGAGPARPLKPRVLFPACGTDPERTRPIRPACPLSPRS